ncbi:MAG: periplasmic heavy metal sensor [Candidatus Omnitrophica bacterium]|nr:periplasmic heavy metal sensor [Candidatus Omnitrophota bacterium]
MKTNILKIIMALGISLVFLSSGLYAQAMGPDNQNGQEQRAKPEFMKKIIEGLALTGEQQEQLKESRQQHRNEFKQIHQSMKEYQVALKEELEKEQPDEAKINTLVAKINSFQARLLDLRVAKVLETKKILTPEQFAKLQSLQKESKEKRKGMRHSWRNKQKSTPEAE